MGEGALKIPRVITKELKAFSKVTQIPVKSDPLLWWGSQASVFPLLYQVAKVLLAIPCSSAPAERLFSKLARVNAKERSRMKPEMAESLLLF